MAKEEKISYTYLGLSETEKETWLREMRKNAGAPRTTEYQDVENDSPSALIHKENKRKKYEALREKEIVEKLEKHDNIREVCGVAFEKSKPFAVADFYRLTIKDGKKVKVPVMVDEIKLAKLDALVLNGVMSRNPPISEGRNARFAKEKEIRDTLNPKLRRRG